MKQAGLWLLAAWLILQGLEAIFKFSFPGDGKVLPIINLIAGAALFLYAVKLKHGNIGLFLLGCWAILQNTLFLFHLTFSHSSLIVPLLGLIAGVFLVVKI
jgi:hypothetical protein